MSDMCNFEYYANVFISNVLVYAMTPIFSIGAGLFLLVQIGILTNKFTFLLFSFSKTLFSSTPFFLLNLKSKMYSLFLFSLSVFTIKIFPPQKNDMKNISLLFSISIHSINPILLLCHFLLKIKKR